MFDPDYRRAPWNHSQYAPKNRRGLSMTQVASMWAGLVFLIPFAGLEAVRQPPLLYGLAGAALAVFLVAGTITRRREYRRLMRSSSEQDIRFAPPTPSAKAKPARTRTGRAFEQEVADIIEAVSGRRAEVVGKAGDGGIDIRVLDKQGRMVGIVQCKDYPGRSVPPGAIRELATVKLRANVGIAYLVTSGRFTPESKAQADSLGIRLLDGQALARLRSRSKTAKVTSGKG